MLVSSSPATRVSPAPSTPTSSRPRSAHRERRARGQNVDIEPVGSKAPRLYRKRYPLAVYEKSPSSTTTTTSPPTRRCAIARSRSRSPATTPASCSACDFDDVAALARTIVERYERAEIDAVYLVFNEFKSVISQRIVVEKLLPIRKLGEREITVAEEMTEEQREAAARPPQPQASPSSSTEDRAAEREAKFGTAEVDYIYDQAPESSSATCCRGTSPPRSSMPCWSRRPPSTPRA